MNTKEESLKKMIKKVDIPELEEDLKKLRVEYNKKIKVKIKFEDEIEFCNQSYNYNDRDNMGKSFNNCFVEKFRKYARQLDDEYEKISKKYNINKNCVRFMISGLNLLYEINCYCYRQGKVENIKEYTVLPDSSFNEICKRGIYTVYGGKNAIRLNINAFATKEEAKEYAKKTLTKNLQNDINSLNKKIIEQINNINRLEELSL